METLDIKQLDKNDERIADSLISLGMNRPIARTLAYLHHVDEATAVELEKGAGLHQPEVSTAMKELKQLDWIKIHEEKKPGKGRPYKIYSLKIGFNEIIAQLEKQQKEELNEAKAMIEKLKELV